MMQTKKPQRAFTLIELSIVLVIIGLIVGGVLVGQDLIKAAQLRKVITEVESYKTAVHTFRVKYNALPGDIKNAIQFWGAADLTPATCVGTIGAGTETCNGNGDRFVNVSTGSHESPRFWQHLANAELISGTYSGIDGAGTAGLGCLADYSNCPSGVLGGSAYNVGYTSVASSNTKVTAFGTSHYFLLGANSLVIGSDDDEPFGAILRPIDAMQIDTKADDGKPSLGFVRSYGKFENPEVLGTYNEVQNCADFGDPATAEYWVTREAPSCALRFLW